MYQCTKYHTSYRHFVVVYKLVNVVFGIVYQCTKFNSQER